MSKNLLPKIKAMMGKTWQRKSKDKNVYKFLAFNVEKETIKIATDKEWLETNIFDIGVFIEDWEEIEVALVVAGNQNKAIIPLANDTVTKLKETILANIEKVKTDKTYIPQAKEINNSINTLINLATFEIKMRGGKKNNND